MTWEEINQAVTAIFERITKAMVDGDQVRIVGFGLFHTKMLPGRNRHFVEYRKVMWVDGKPFPAFKPSPQLVRMINSEQK